MDPVAHTLFGTALAAGGLRRATALATPTLIVAANAPDVDVLTLAAGPYTSLALRRGLTHGVLALLVLPFVVAGAVLLWDRWIRLRRTPGADPARAGPLLGLATLGVWSHPLLDWLNTYGMRWLLPFDGRWSYGDAVFIVDPWLWLLLGGAGFVVYSATSRAQLFWALLALALSLPVLLLEGIPGWARFLWIAGLVGMGLLRVWAGREGDPGPPASRAARGSRACLVLAVLYAAAMVGQTLVARGLVVHEAEARGIAPVTDVMVGPAPVDPRVRQVIVETREAYRTGVFHWTRAPRVDWDEEALARLDRSDPAIQAAERHPEAARYLTWARFPVYELEEDGAGWLVRIRDVRYVGRSVGGLGGIEVRVSRELEPVEAGPLGLALGGGTGPSGQSMEAQSAIHLARERTSPGPPFPGVVGDSVLYAATFDTVWTRIRDTHYDPQMAGLDWDGLRHRLRPRAVAATGQGELRTVLRELLDHLGDSHFAILPGGTPEPHALGGGGGDPGIEVRWMDDAALVTRVRDGGPAHGAGVRPGHLLLAMDGTMPEDFLKGTLSDLARADPSGAADTVRTFPPYWPDALLAGWLQGDPGEEREFTFLDESDRERRARVRLEAPPGQTVRFGNLPPFHLLVEDRALTLDGEGQAGFIRFTGWFPQIVPEVARAVDRYRDGPGIVLDLRGNPGGVGGLVMGIGGHFLDERMELGFMRTRDTELRFVVNPQRIGPDGTRVTPFQGPLAILVDRSSASTSEIFAGGMQALGRARVFGETTAGEVLPAILAELPNGDRLMHAVADFTGPDGVRIEGRGVEPDERIVPTRSALLAEPDPALARALQWIAQSSNPNEDSPP